MFGSITLDTRLQQALNQLGYKDPTLVQQKAIPLALEDKKDIVARAKTGSGKTAAYVIPIVESILKNKGHRALVLVPTRELSEQVYKVLMQMTVYCESVIKAVNIAQDIKPQVQTSLLQQNPEIIVATPARAMEHVNNGNIDPDELKYLVIDEADLVVSLGHGEDMQQLGEKLAVKKQLQVWLMSATLSDEVEEMKQQFCRDTAILKLEQDDEEDDDKLVQYYAKCSELDKFLLAYVIFKLNLIKGKTIIFVNNVDRCYRLKLFFEQFGIKACTLNAELPIASRLHIVEQFNKNVYNLVIATDEAQLVDEEETTSSTKKDKRDKRKDKEFGVSRGVDFQNVSCVVNFDLPTSAKAYTHRIGRTARAKKTGMALSFVVPKVEHGKHRHSTLESSKRDEKILGRIVKQQDKLGHEIKPYQFDMKQVESFRYRMEDAFRAVTKVAVREARDREFRQELIASEKLTRHFEENPEDLIGLRHDKTLHPTRVQSHLKRVPEYLLPKNAQSQKDIGMVGFNKNSGNRIRKIRNHKRNNAAAGKKKNDPLKSFKQKK